MKDCKLVASAEIVVVPVADRIVASAQSSVGNLYSNPLALISSEPCVIVPWKVAVVFVIEFGCSVITVGSTIGGVTN